MKNQLRTLIAAWKEQPYTQLRAADHRGWNYGKLTSQIADLAGYKVLSGPYRGMRYFSPAGIPIIDPAPTAKLLGSFEEEIHPWIESLATRDFPTIVHLGGGEGYHAVGMARRFPAARTVVFDTLIAARKASRALAQQNEVRDRMQLRGFCAGDGLLDIELAGSLIFSDCGGAELVLLDPQLYPNLRLATMLVETHDAFDARITPRLVSRFSETHTMEFVSVADRDWRKYPLLRDVPPETARAALDERRETTRDGKPQTWALLTPYSS